MSVTSFDYGNCSVTNEYNPLYSNKSLFKTSKKKGFINSGKFSLSKVFTSRSFLTKSLRRSYSEEATKICTRRDSGCYSISTDGESSVTSAQEALDSLEFRNILNIEAKTNVKKGTKGLNVIYRARNNVYRQTISKLRRLNLNNNDNNNVSDFYEGKKLLCRENSDLVEGVNFKKSKTKKIIKKPYYLLNRKSKMEENAFLLRNETENDENELMIPPRCVNDIQQIPLNIPV